jgi:hypothetical protein
MPQHRRWSTDGKQRSSLFHAPGKRPNLHCTRVTTDSKLPAEDNEEDMKELNEIAGMHAAEMAVDETAMNLKNKKIGQDRDRSSGGPEILRKGC